MSLERSSTWARPAASLAGEFAVTAVPSAAAPASSSAVPIRRVHLVVDVVPKADVADRLEIEPCRLRDVEACDVGFDLGGGSRAHIDEQGGVTAITDEFGNERVLVAFGIEGS